MLALIVIGTVVQMIHHKNVTYFFNNAKKAKLAAERELGTGEKTSIILKTVVHDIATTAELGAGKRRVAHVIGYVWNYFILGCIFSSYDFLLYRNRNSCTNNLANDLACWSNNDLCGGYWFWLFLRVDVLQKLILGIELLKQIYLFLALLACATLDLHGLIFNL